ncbi:hypothetical protein O6H91_13G013500 [Diphasiastrum complanatum]|uniref:Uncharacterized protein n=1 Tax=Diphasiastrum complanatum TaxID=34168 RepID=A0ACC2BTB0_DIPCM|nr:hypothetical protein O6H91_13G013500 [Diphasiastrum complanatum]
MPSLWAVRVRTIAVGLSEYAPSTIDALDVSQRHGSLIWVKIQGNACLCGNTGREAVFYRGKAISRYGCQNASLISIIQCTRSMFSVARDVEPHYDLNATWSEYESLNDLSQGDNSMAGYVPSTQTSASVEVLFAVAATQMDARTVKGKNEQIPKLSHVMKSRLTSLGGRTVSIVFYLMLQSGGIHARIRDRRKTTSEWCHARNCYRTQSQCNKVYDYK